MQAPRCLTESDAQAGCAVLAWRTACWTWRSVNIGARPNSSRLAGLTETSSCAGAGRVAGWALVAFIRVEPDILIPHKPIAPGAQAQTAGPRGPAAWRQGWKGLQGLYYTPAP